MPPKQLNLFYFFHICVFLVSARTEADKQVFKIQFLFMLISHNYVQLTVRDLFWLSSLPSGSHDLPSDFCWVQVLEGNTLQTVNQERCCEDGAGQREKQQERSKCKGCRGSNNILEGLFFISNKCWWIRTGQRRRRGKQNKKHAHGW